MKAVRRTVGQDETEMCLSECQPTRRHLHRYEIYEKHKLILILYIIFSILSVLIYLMG